MILKDIIDFSGILVVLFGALIEVYGVLRMKLSFIIRQTQTFCGYNSKHYESLIDQRIRMVSGFVMISAGTLLQLASRIIPIDLLRSRYLPYWVVIVIWISIVIVTVLVMRRRIRFGVNYFLVPEVALNLKAKLDNYQDADQRLKVNYDKSILNYINELEKMLKINVGYVSVEESELAIKELFKVVEEYCRNNKVNKPFPSLVKEGIQSI